jgi:hypothetical protein
MSTGWFRGLCCAGAAIAAAGLSFHATAQTGPLAPLASHVEALSGFDSGLVSADGMGGPSIVYTASVRVAGASWLRLSFGEVVLAGDPRSNGSVIRVTSLADGAVQTLNADSLAQWRYTSAYFNGEEVLVELLAYPGAGASRVVINGATAGDANPISGRTLCGNDDRVPSAEGGNARILPDGCTSFLISDANHTMLTAGHCGVSATTVVQFNVPPSTSTGGLVSPSPRDQYVVDPASVQYSDGGLGNDWTYFGCFPNSNTGLTPYQAQGQFYTIAPHPTMPSGQSLRITGYGTVTAPMPVTLTQTQQTSVGPYVGWDGNILYYAVDTTGGNSGSPVLDLASGRVIGIHTNAGCTATGGANQGTAIDCPGLVNALAHPQGVCVASGGNTQHCSADFNNDGASGTDADIEDFFRALSGLVCGTCGSPDFDGDGAFGTDRDIEAFFRVLAGGPC